MKHKGERRTDRSAESPNEREREGDENLGIHRRQNPRTDPFSSPKTIAIRERDRKAEAASDESGKEMRAGRSKLFSG